MKQVTQLTTPIAIMKPTHMTGLLLQTWNASKEEVKDVLSHYDKMGLPAILPEEFNRLFNDTKALLYDKITGGSTQIVGGNGAAINIDRSKALEIIEKPEGYDAFIKSINEFEVVCMNANRVGETASSSYPKEEITKYFLLNDNGEVDFTESLKLRIDEAENTYITTDRGEAVHRFMTAITEKFFEFGLDEYFPRTGLFSPTSQTYDDKLPGNMLASLITDNMREIDYLTKTHREKFHGGANNPYYMADSKTYRLSKVE